MIDIDRFTQKMSIKYTEDMDNFIFEVMRPFCEEVAKMTVSKEYLSQLLTKSVPLSVIEDIKGDIDNERNTVLNTTSNFTPNNVLDVIDYIVSIIDKRISEKESTNADSN